MSSDADVASLTARIAELEAEKAKLMPTLRTRTALKFLYATPEAYMGRVVGIGGWVKQLRTAGGGKFAFVKLGDGTVGSELQCVVNGQLDGFSDIEKGACVFFIGEIVPSKGSEQAFEMVAQQVQVLGACPQETYPLAGKNLSLEYMRGLGHFRPRSTVLGAVFRIRNALAYATHTFYQSRGFQYAHTPLITASDCEGGGEMFQVTTLLDDGKLTNTLPDGKADYSKDFFKQPAFLTVSGQLNGEIMAHAFSSIYTFGPTFRAEDSHTSRHLSEFWMIEPEICFADLTENMDVAEAYLKHVMAAVIAQCGEDVKVLEAFEKRRAGDRKKAEAEVKAALAKEAKAKKKAEQAAASAAAKEAKEAGDQADVKPAADPEKEAKIAAQAEVVRALKASGTASKDEIQVAVNVLLTLKGQQPKKKQQQKGKDKKGKDTAAQDASATHWRDQPLGERLRMLVNTPFKRVTYTDAITLLQKAVTDGVEFVESNIEWGMDLSSEHERYMCETVFRCPTFVTDYPKDIKAFYMRMNEDGKTVAAMDVLVPGVGELMGGSQREERVANLEARMKEMDLDPAGDDYKWYLDLRRYGGVQHSGFGVGFGRLVCYATGIENIRDAIPFPRYPGHADY